MRLYLAGPMTGYEDNNFPAFNKAATQLRIMGHYVFSPAENYTEVYREALEVDLTWICKMAEGIALMAGWEKSKGATAEYYTAIALGLKVVMQDFDGDWYYPYRGQEP